MSKKKIVIDPVTRIEGHLRIEVEIDENNVVKEARAAGQLFRGIEIILKGRDPRDAGLIAQRICGVCTNVHYRASVTAVENAYGIVPPPNAQIIRNLITLSLFVQDHIVHFYHLHSLDYVDIVSALEADVKKAEEVAVSYHDYPYRSSVGHFSSIKEKLTSFVKAGRLGLFANGYWGHDAYRLSPEENLILVNHYMEALRIQTTLSKAIAIFTGKTPHPQNLVVGGVTSVADMLNPQRLNDFIFIIKDVHDFIERAYIPDMKLLVNAYKEEMKSGVGRGSGNFMAAGSYMIRGEEKIFEDGVIFDHDFDGIEPFDEKHITEEMARSWYKSDSNDPYSEKTEPFYTDLNEDGTLKGEEKYSWIKSPRYRAKPMEVGPAARMIVGYLKDSKRIKPVLKSFMEETGMELIDLSSTIGRNVARAVEAKICSDAIFDFCSDLIENIKYYDEETWTKFDFDKLPKETQGCGIHEVPRGVLSHFVRIEEGKIANYQVIAPTTWNASPKGEKGKRGPYEESLIGIRLSDPSRPLEVLRVVHSFDPCIACAVHIVNTRGKSLSQYRISPV